MNDETNGERYTGPTKNCQHCGRNVPREEFCGACGGHLPWEALGSAGRHHAYAAAPNEHMFHLTAVSTMCPHLPHRRTAPFQYASFVTLALLLTLALLRFTGPTIAAAAVCVPILYLLYLWEVEVYEDEPLLVISATFVLGLLLGVPWARLTGPIVTNTLMQDVTLGSAPGLDFVVGIIFPLIAQALMLVGPMILLYTQKFDEALDGYAFGVASALGFSLSTTVVNLWPQLQNGFVSSIPISENIIVVLERGLIIPFLYASTTGLIAGALWLRRGRVRSILVHGWTTTAEIAVVIPVIVWCVLGLINIFVLTPVRVLITYLVAAIIMALWVRVALHHMLLAEAVEVEVGSLQQCFNCYRVVPRMAFCPHCGIATRATPKTGHGRHRRRYR